MKQFDTINKEVSKAFDIPISDIRSRSQEQEILFARYAAMYIVRKTSNLTLKVIGKHYGGRTHDTVIRALTQANILIEQDNSFLHSLCKAWNNVENYDRG